MRTAIYDLALEMEYAREMLQQARIDLAAAVHGRPPASDARLEALRAAVDEREAYLRRVLHEYATALPSPLA